MDEERRISQSLYRSLKMIIGDDVMIHIRRTATSLEDEIENIRMQIENEDIILHCSGSHAEGFRFKSSDVDWMFEHRYIRVVPSFSNTALYDGNAVTILMMDNERTKPGFSLLRLSNATSQQFLQLTTENLLNAQYVSSKLWRELHFAKSANRDLEFIHGPCTSGVLGGIEYDTAHTLKCDTWPPDARGSIKRLQQCRWPSPDTIQSIIRGGVLFVPIGARGSNYENTEWRMSFSLAEKKLVHAMNHTQFLCYALLKILLKEAINTHEQVKGLFCSYYLKTAVLWEITSSSTVWNPFTLLSHFWNCFRLLLQWVICSYCPNFFIPQNNMFSGKIEGANRDNLLQHLSNLYGEGSRCLLRCPSIARGMSVAIHMPITSMQSDMRFIQVLDLIVIFVKLRIINGYNRAKRNMFRCAAIYDIFSTTNNVVVEFISMVLLHEALTPLCHADFVHQFTPLRRNKLHYRAFAQRMKALKRCRTDSVCHYLHQADLCYNIGKYNQCLELVRRAKMAISVPGSMYTFMLIYLVDDGPVRKLGGHRRPVDTIMKKSLIGVFMAEDLCLPELYIEAHGRSFSFVMNEMFIPPLIFAFFLQYLCYRSLGLQHERDDVLYELSHVVQCDDGHHIHPDLRAVSWEILGICQQSNGDNHGACNSYLIALNQDANVFKIASCIRIGTILAEYF